MSEFHYVRTRGSDGGVDACEGPAIGLDLDTVLKDGLPPWNVALEIVAALCEILDIADEDGEVHGDVAPKYVFIDETGAVSLEGFGVKRKKGRAPEGTAKDTRTDLYGLGYTSYRVFCDYALPEVVPTQSSAHDDLVVDAALAIDLSGVPDAMQGDIQWYLAKLMEFDPALRPRPVDAWRTFLAFAQSTPGADMAEWCAAALDGGGVRRAGAKPAGPMASNGVAAASSGPPSVAAAAPPAAPPKEDEELPGLVVQKGPMSAKVAFDEGAGKGATAFWDRDSIKKALEVESDEGKAPAPGGGNATAFWTPQQLDAMQRGGEDAPRPRRAEGEGERRRSTAGQRTGMRSLPPASLGPGSVTPPQSVVRPSFTQNVPAPDASYHGPLDPPSGPISGKPSTGPLQAGPAPSSAPMSVFVPSSPARPDAAPAAPPPAPTPGRTVSPPASPASAPTSVPAARPPDPPPPEPAESGGGGIGFVLFGGGVAAAAMIGGVIVILALLILVLVIALPGRDPVPPQLPEIEPVEAPISQPANVQPGQPTPPDPGTAQPATPEPPRPTPSQPTPSQPTPSQPKPTPSQPTPSQPTPSQPKPTPSQPKPTPSQPKPAEPAPSSPKPVPAVTPSAPKPKPAVSSDDARVTIRSSGSGSVSSCVPTKIEYTGQTSFTIDSYLLPATCLVVIEGARGVFQVYKSGSTSCEKQGTTVQCDHPEIK